MSASCRFRRELSNDHLVGTYLQTSASTQRRTSPVKFARSPRTDPPGAHGDRPLGGVNDFELMVSQAVQRELQKLQAYIPPGARDGTYMHGQYGGPPGAHAPPGAPAPDLGAYGRPQAAAPYLQNLASILRRTSPVKFARSPRTDPPGAASVSCVWTITVLS